MESRDSKARALHEAACSYRYIAKTLNMSLRDVTKAIKCGTVTSVTNGPDSLSCKAPAVTAALPPPSVTTLPSALPMLAEWWGAIDATEANLLGRIDPLALPDILAPLRLLHARLMLDASPLSEAVNKAVSIEHGPLGPGYIDPLTLIEA